MIILGIDPGYEKMGVAVIDKNPKTKKEICVFSDCIKTDRAFPHAERLLKISNELQIIISKYHPDSLGIETLFFTNNQKTAVKVAEARGVALTEAARAGLAIYEFSPLEIKIAVTGYGRSDKKQVISMVEKLVSLQKPIKEDDEYDAIAAALTCSASAITRDIRRL
ncbi:MAG: crossover junction endodeoxyribonuclease RuvC [Candidatus Paceibacterota bacterium]|jgi:crossover junction endodeoxyribonuclease RuvC